jgi:hypothetical protein
MQWREIKGKGGGWGIHVESLVDRYRWTDLYACKNGLHCSKMNMLNALDFPIYSSCIFSSKLEFSI